MDLEWFIPDPTTIVFLKVPDPDPTHFISVYLEIVLKKNLFSIKK